MNATVSNSYQLLPALERAQFFTRRIKEGTSASLLAKELGKSLAYISNTLRLLRLPEVVKDALISNVISEGHARALLGARDETKCLEVFKKVLAEDLNVRQTELLVRKTALPAHQSGLEASNETAHVLQ